MLRKRYVFLYILLLGGKVLPIVAWRILDPHIWEFWVDPWARSGPPPYAQPRTRVYLDRSGPGELKDALAGPRRGGGTMPFGPSRSESGFRTRTHLHLFCGKCEKVHPRRPKIVFFIKFMLIYVDFGSILVSI